MSGSMRTRWVSLSLATGLFAAALALATLARAGGPVPGGTVPSTLGLSMSEPSGFKRVGGAGSRGVYTSTIRAEVTATDSPVLLSIADGEATQGRRHGHLVGGSSILSPALEVAADGGSYRSLDASPPPQLQRWGAPVSLAATKIRVRQVAPSARVLRNHHKLLLVTLTAAGP
jgi:hypothetical protein